MAKAAGFSGLIVPGTLVGTCRVLATECAPVIPTAPMLDRRTYASPMSYIGATRRTTALIW